MWRRGGFLLGRILDDTNASHALRTVRRVERRRVEKAQARRATEGTNPYNKAQYINAFVEAESARMTHERLMKENAAEEQSLLAVVNAARPPVVMASDKNVPPGKTESGAVAFGAWREADPALDRVCLSMDRNLHCIVRGATTPPAFSPEALQRGIPTRLQSVQRLLQFVHANGHGRWPKGRLNAFAVRMETCLSAACGDDFSMRQRLMTMLLYSAAKRNWELAFQLYQELLLPAIQQQQRRVGEGVGAVTGTEASASASTFVAVLCESIRAYHHAGALTSYSCPPFNTVAELVHPSSPPLLPVAAAPLFSILQPSNNATWEKVVELVQRFQPHGNARMYLPAIAWGEMLRAMHRMGASLTEVQGVVDIITDPNRTKNAEKHMRDTHIWNAYISVSDWGHALEVYSNNLAHYGVKKTAATSAALMESLLRDRQWEQALDVFHRLQQKEGQLIIGTSSVFTAVFQALEQQGDWQAVVSLLMDFDHFLVYFGVPHDFWLTSPLREALRRPQHLSEDQLVPLVRELLGCSHVTCELVRAVEAALVTCNQQKRQREQHPQHELSAGAEDVCDDILTAEGLHDLM
ncbi:oxidoreductase [Trypanosoma rangeli]|uniref:Oxidoreductase n=1 Tax=Trypanosoma rangeli TaxID=5698 RepID=A0A3R7MH20_TRYRA|nr:oxidoreductase [Trypanosoma rangeli]RNF05721.1 oxidoreductase [Trypanosoma rangeli]|eukprot:RNF05721.1 oxidoreductase [Trypanosoma rangeli]